VTTIFLLLLVFQAKHWVADFPLQSNRYMLGKFREDWGFVGPLLAHVAVHASMTFLIVLAVLGRPWAALGCAGFDAGVHFVMDRIKASPRWLGRYKSLTAETAKTATAAQWRSNHGFWWSLGLDQGIHHMTHYAVIWYCVTHR
jgi:hypothetical protein